MAELEHGHVLSLILNNWIAIPSSGRGRNLGAYSQSQSVDHPAQTISCLSENGRSPVHQLKVADPIMLAEKLVGSNGSFQSHSAEQWMVG